MLKKKNIFIGIGIIFALVVLFMGGFYISKTKEIDNYKKLGIKYLSDAKYKEALAEFNNILLIDEDNEQAKNLSELVNDYIRLESAYENEDYNKAIVLIEKLKENEHISYVKNSVEEMSLNIDKKSDIKKELESLNDKVDKLILENRYEEAASLLGNYENKDLEKENLERLNELKKRINQSKAIYKEKELKNKKNEYINKIKRLENEVDVNYRYKMDSASTADGVRISKERYEKWDKLINEIWKDLPNLLSKSDMNNLTKKQLDWIKEKEQLEKDTKTYMEGAHINFIMINIYDAWATMTNQRCYELVNNYM